MDINGLRFVMTCSACPEQYDVYDKTGRMVGYIRFRWGYLSCSYPDVGGEEIYSASIGDGFTGSFENERQRRDYLTRIANEITKRLSSSRKSIK